MPICYLTRLIILTILFNWVKCNLYSIIFVFDITYVFPWAFFRKHVQVSPLSPLRIVNELHYHRFILSFNMPFVKLPIEFKLKCWLRLILKELKLKLHFRMLLHTTYIFQIWYPIIIQLFYLETTRLTLIIAYLQISPKQQGWYFNIEYLHQFIDNILRLFIYVNGRL